MLTRCASRAASPAPKVTFRLLSTAGRAAALLLAVLICTTAASANGRKYGLFVGINEYPSADDRLYGAVNDATRLREAVVKHFAFAPADTTVLTDAGAKREAIIDAIKRYGDAARAGDLFVFTYSGHGTVFPDASSEQLDEARKIEMDLMLPEGRFVLPLAFYDSALVPFDADARTGGRTWQNLILDDELYDLFSAFTRKGAHVVFLSDSCHSGTIGKAVGSESARGKFLSPLRALKAASLDELKAARPRNQRKVTGRSMGAGSYLILTGSKDDEFSLDVGRGTPDAAGLFTRTLLGVVQRDGTQLTYRELIARVRPEVRRLTREQDNDQTPQLDVRFGNPNVRIFSAAPPVRSRRSKSPVRPRARRVKPAAV